MGYSNKSQSPKLVMPKDKATKDKQLCQLLGFFIPIFGLLISAVIAKGDGVRYALPFAVINFALLVVILIFM